MFEPADPTTAAALARLYDLDLTEDPGDLDLYLALADRVGEPDPGARGRAAAAWPSRSPRPATA